MDKNQIIELLKQNTKQVMIVGIGIVLSIVLYAIGGTLGGIGVILAIATIVYAVRAFNSIKKANEKQKEAEEKARAEKSIEEFKANFNADAEIEQIFSVIKDNPTLTVFEQGIDNLIAKNNITVEKNIVRSLLIDAMMKRVVNRNQSADDPATVLISSVFAKKMKSVLTDDYVMIAQADMHIKNASSSNEVKVWSEHTKDTRVSFVKNLYGIAVRASNYASSLQNEKGYAPISDRALSNLIKNDTVIQSYCQDNPFEADEKNAEWLTDLRKAAITVAQKSELAFDAEADDKTLDMLCYMGYRTLTEKEGTSTVVIADDILNVIKPYCEKLVRRVG